MTKNDNSIPIVTHLLGLFTGFIGPLIILLVVEDKNAKRHSKVALNWQFSLLIYMVVSFILVIVFIGILTAVALAIMNLVFSIIATVRASEGKIWEYPLSIKFFKV